MSTHARKCVLAWERCANDTVVGIPPRYEEKLSEQFDIVWEKEVEANLKMAATVDAAFVTADRPIPMIYDRPDLFPKLKLVVTLSAGLNHIDLDSLRSRGIRLATTACFTDAVAEMALTLLLTLTRDISLLQHDVRNPASRQSRLCWTSPGISKSTVAIVGLGRIGYKTAELIKPHGCKILYFDPQRRSPADEDNVGAKHCENLCEMLAESDNVIVTCPLNSTTEGMFGESEFATMKPSATFINVARGKVVQTEPLTRALQDRRLRGAGIDVTDLPLDHPLLSMDNVIVTPHCGASSLSAMEAAFTASIECLSAGLTGKSVATEVKF